MSSYCLSDVHGELESLELMLRKIGFSSGDTLYLLGDAIDRGDHSLEVLRLVMETPNIVMLRGNHEQMLLDAMGPRPEPFARRLWLDNGGKLTHFAFTALPRGEQNAILDFLQGLPDQLEIEVSGKRYLLVHACPGDGRARLWGEVKPWADYGYAGTVIFGHTPTRVYLDGSPRKHDVIWHGKGRIGIDCGCGIRRPGSKLGCIRLEDMAKFYV
ncbi:MAG: metallophosphoesterase [Oscillospiraceae bacterium]|nr:metallophosphoesterase [Oscillospiraceae bacterium]